MLFGIIFSTMLLVSNFQISKAALGFWETFSKPNIKGTSTGYAGKMVRKLSSVQWAGDIVSYTDNPPVAIPLGWTHFTTRETCNGNIKQQVVKGGASVNSTQRAETTFMSTMSCTGTRKGNVLGNHELKGTTTWYKDWTRWDVIP